MMSGGAMEPASLIAVSQAWTACCVTGMDKPEQVRSLCWIRHTILVLTANGCLSELDIRSGKAQVTNTLPMPKLPSGCHYGLQHHSVEFWPAELGWLTETADSG